MLPHSWIEPQIMWKVQFWGLFLNKPPLFTQKVHVLRDFFNWPPPKNLYWKIKPWGSIGVDTLCHDIECNMWHLFSKKNFNAEKCFKLSQKWGFAEKNHQMCAFLGPKMGIFRKMQEITWNFQKCNNFQKCQMLFKCLNNV